MSDYYIPSTCQVEKLNDIYLKYFGYTNKGFFIDVGAYDGFQHSNTWGLAHASWEGICYEPIPEYYTKCVQNHSGHHNIKVIETCIGDREGIVDINVAGTLSTYNDHQLKTEYWKNEYSSSYKITTKITTLNKTLKENNVKQGFEVLSLDVEGSESDVLKFFDINYWLPKMGIVEVQELHEAQELALQAPFINEYFANAEYEKIYCDGINNIYVLKEMVGNPC